MMRAPPFNSIATLKTLTHNPPIPIFPPKAPSTGEKPYQTPYFLATATQK